MLPKNLKRIRQSTRISPVRLLRTSHRPGAAIAKELKSNPSLVSSDAFMAKNPALSAWLTAHPDVAKELQTNPQVS